MGIEKIYKCDNPGCEAIETFHQVSDLHDITDGGWLVVHKFGGCSVVYCPKCRDKHEEKITPPRKFPSIYESLFEDGETLGEYPWPLD